MSMRSPAYNHVAVMQLALMPFQLRHGTLSLFNQSCCATALILCHQPGHYCHCHYPVPLQCLHAPGRFLRRCSAALPGFRSVL